MPDIWVDVRDEAAPNDVSVIENSNIINGNPATNISLVRAIIVIVYPKDMVS